MCTGWMKEFNALIMMAARVATSSSCGITITSRANHSVDLHGISVIIYVVVMVVVVVVVVVDIAIVRASRQDCITRKIAAIQNVGCTAALLNTTCTANHIRVCCPCHVCV